MPATHYHVVSLTDSGHQSAGYPDFDQAQHERDIIAQGTGDPSTVISCQHPACELVALGYHHPAEDLAES